MSKVTQILCYYNEEKYIEESLKALMTQTYSDMEIIAISDGSTDRSVEIVEKYALKDKRIRSIVNTENHGLAWVRNQGLDLATGEYVGFIDADDIAYPDRVEKMASFLDANEDYFLVTAMVEYMNEEGETLSYMNNKYKSNEEIKAVLLFGDPITDPNTLFRREPIQKYGIRNELKYKTGQDFNFWIKCINFGKYMALDDVLLRYRVHESKSNAFNDKNKNLVDSWIKEIILFSWNSRGLELTDRELEYVYHSMKFAIRAKNIEDIFVGRRLYKKLLKQLSELNLSEEKEIIKEYIYRYNESVRYIYPLYLH